MPDDHLELLIGNERPAAKEKNDRRYIGVQFACRGVYTKVYVNKD